MSNLSSWFNRSTPAPGSPEAIREQVRRERLPNETLVNQDGRALRFYDDVMKNQRVVVNVMYTVCSNTCTPSMRNLMEARTLLGDTAKGVKFVSITLTPETDTPEALREYRKSNGVPADWTFLTGKPQAVQRVQRGLGFISDREDEDLYTHSTVARYCDEPLIKWTHVNTLLAPRTIARMLRFEIV